MRVGRCPLLPRRLGSNVRRATVISLLSTQMASMAVTRALSSASASASVSALRKNSRMLHGGYYSDGTRDATSGDREDCKGVGKGRGQRSIPALFVRGGTSTGLVLRAEDLDGDGDADGGRMERWKDVLATAMGSPDPVHGRQLDGMGGGVSSTSKVCVLAPPPRPSSSSSFSRSRSRVRLLAEPETRDGKEEEEEVQEADVDFTFVQVGIRDGELDLAGNCGNMSAVVGPVAWNWGFVPEGERRGRITEVVGEGEEGEGEVVREAFVNIFNTNTNKIIRSRFRVSGDPPMYDPRGGYAMDGVPGMGSRITLSFINPAGAKTGRALPTGNPVDVLSLPDGSTVRASLVDVSNPGVFVALEDLLLPPTWHSNSGPRRGKNNDSLVSPPDGACGKESSTTFLTPASIEADEGLKERLEMIRRQGARKMGLDPDVQSVPKIVLLFPPSRANSQSGEGYTSRESDSDSDRSVTGPREPDLRCLAMSMGQAHKAVPLTLALCLGAAANIPGTIAAEIVRERVGKGAHEEGKGKGTQEEEESRSVVIAHPSGTVEIGATFRNGEIVSADLHRTARYLMKGEVYY
ncbi:DUF453-domain-containing protein [Xylariaceae sp. FL0594]|nr:DUF453-domain-containing protein [Xylariaceae sp. FL0594]